MPSAPFPTEPFIYSSFPTLERWISAASLHRDLTMLSVTVGNESKADSYSCFKKFFRIHFNLQEIPVKFIRKWLPSFLWDLSLNQCLRFGFISSYPLLFIRSRFERNIKFLNSFQETVCENCNNQIYFCTEICSMLILAGRTWNFILQPKWDFSFSLIIVLKEKTNHSSNSFESSIWKCSEVFKLNLIVSTFYGDIFQLQFLTGEWMFIKFVWKFWKIGGEFLLIWWIYKSYKFTVTMLYATLFNLRYLSIKMKSVSNL